MSGEPSDSTVIQAVILMALLMLSAFFSSAETSMTAINKMRIRALADAGDKRAIILTKVLEDQGKMLSAVLIGNNIANLSAASLMTTIAIQLFGSKAVGIATGVLTLIILVFAEITPKTMATLYPDKFAYRYARCIYCLMMVATPIIWCINRLSFGILILLRMDPKKKQESITEEELRTIVEVSHEEGVIELEERKMINNVVDFGDSVARDIMVPHIDMVLVDVDASYEELIDIFREEMFTRIPVYEGSADNVIGVINMKDLLLWDRSQEFSIRNFLREPLYTYEFKKTPELMLEMRKTLNNIAIVLDEYGAMAGLITLEDMLEEIVGEIRDEYDADEENNLRQIGEGIYLVEGSMKLDDINDYLELHLDSEDCDSVGGLIISLLEHLPEQGEEVTYENIRLRAEQVEKNRIDKVRLMIMDAGEAEG